MTMREFADHILARAQETKHPVTNLSLQKIMYFVLRNSSQILTRDEQEEIYSEPFLVWRYGPVVESEYNRFNIFGSSEIVGEYQANQRYEKLNPLMIASILIGFIFTIVYALLLWTSKVSGKSIVDKSCDCLGRCNNIFHIYGRHRFYLSVVLFSLLCSAVLAILIQHYNW